MFPLCYICFTKIVQFEKRNSGDVQLIFIFTYKYSEKRAEEKWPRFFILNHIVKRDGCKKTAVSFIIIGKRMLLFGHRFI